MKGRITGFSATWGSGIATLLIDGVPILCENAPTVRALDACFGCIADGHTIDVSRIAGQNITYEIDELGMLLSFAPLEEGLS